jgi:hypothetical protein
MLKPFSMMPRCLGIGAGTRRIKDQAIVGRARGQPRRQVLHLGVAAERDLVATERIVGGGFEQDNLSEFREPLRVLALR